MLCSLPSLHDVGLNPNNALMVAQLVQAFEWSGHPSQPPLDFKDKMEFTVVMDLPLLTAVKPQNLSF